MGNEKKKWVYYIHCQKFRKKIELKFNVTYLIKDSKTTNPIPTTYISVRTTKHTQNTQNLNLAHKTELCSTEARCAVRRVKLKDGGDS